MSTIYEILIWIVNGFLLICYYAADHILTLSLVASASLFAARAPVEQRAMSVGSSALAILASLLSPAPVPLFLLVMSLAGWAGQALEHYNRSAMRWDSIRSQAIYAIAGIAFAAYRFFHVGDAISSDPMMAQGSTYLGAIIGIAMYVIPLGSLAMMVQSIWAHPPSPGGTPGQMITTVRTRGKKQ